jgi:hypothetical protein
MTIRSARGDTIVYRFCILDVLYPRRLCKLDVDFRDVLYPGRSVTGRLVNRTFYNWTFGNWKFCGCTHSYTKLNGKYFIHFSSVFSMCV